MSSLQIDRNKCKRRNDSDDESDVSDCCIQLTPQENIIHSTSRSPGSGGKYYSPTKKRYVTKRPPMKRKFNIDLLSPMDDNILMEACIGLDDKSVFLLKIINKCLNSGPLKILLDETSQDIINKCFNAVKPGITLVCRMYWRKTIWYRYEEVEKICKENYKCDGNMVQTMIKHLVENGLLDCGGAEWSIDNFAEVMKAEELRTICKDLKIKYSNKEKALQSLKQYRPITVFFNKNTNGSKNQRVRDKMRELCGDFYRLSDLARKAIHKLYVLMYLGADYSWIREGKLELVLINDKAKIETYPIDKDMKLDDASDVFSSQYEFEKYFNVLSLYDNFLTINDNETMNKIVLEVYEQYKNITADDMASYISYPEWLRKFTPAQIYVHILESGVQTLKRLKDYESALDILTTLIEQVAFRQHKKADWYSEKALIYKTIGKHDMAAEVLLAAFQSDLPKDAKDVMRNRAKNIAKQKNTNLDEEKRTKLKAMASDGQILENSFPAMHVDVQPMESTGKGKVKFYVRSENSTSVMDAENYCIRHYVLSGRFTDGGHWEGRLVTTIFFLLFWDIIYTKPRGLTGIFLSYFQRHPLDIYTESFYTNRKTLIKERLQTIENYTEEDLTNVLQERWNDRPMEDVSELYRGPYELVPQQVLSVCVSLGGRRVAALCHRLATQGPKAYQGFPDLIEVSELYRGPHGLVLRQVVSVCVSLGGRRVAALCHRLATQGPKTCQGFPDLTLWNHHTKQIIFVEVKTDSDSPSVKQLQWMDYLKKHDMQVEFCYVGAKTKRQKARAANE